MTKTELHRLVDELPDESVHAAAVLLEQARDPFSVRLALAPLDDEPYPEQEQDADVAALATLRAVR